VLFLCYTVLSSFKPVIQLRPHQQNALDAMLTHAKGQVIVPTGGGKTLVAIMDAQRRFSIKSPRTIVVVAPRLLLARQLSNEFTQHIKNAAVLHVHSGGHDFPYHCTTDPSMISKWDYHTTCHKLIFTTYHSLHRIQESKIVVDCIYFDEAHNSVKRNFFPATEHFSAEADRCYFFTATPKHSLTIAKPGMNMPEVYGNVICKVGAPELVEGGYILPPKVVVKQLPMVIDKKHVAECDAENLIETINENSLNKILVCARSTKQIIRLIGESEFVGKLHSMGYSWMTITSKTGAIIDGQKVTREEFFDTLNSWGGTSDKKFVVLHHSILSEGINVNGLEAVLFMRNMDYIGISQSIGRVIRLGDSSKTFGLVCVPVYDKVGISTARSVQAVVDTVFEQGNPAISVIRR